MATPPWSKRVPNMELEEWVSTTKRAQEAFRADWKAERPEGFHAQERRRAVWLRAKAERRGPPPVVVLAVKGTAQKMITSRPQSANGTKTRGMVARGLPVRRPRKAIIYLPA